MHHKTLLFLLETWLSQPDNKRLIYKPSACWHLSNLELSSLDWLPDTLLVWGSLSGPIKNDEGQAGGLLSHALTTWARRLSALATVLSITRLHFDITFVPCTLQKFSLQLHRTRFYSRFSEKAIDGQHRACFPSAWRMDREAWRAAVCGITELRHDWVTELNWKPDCSVWFRSYREAGIQAVMPLKDPLLPSSLSSSFLFPSFLPLSPGHQVCLWRLIVRNFPGCPVVRARRFHHQGP